jgi:hypothetical protein
VVSIVVAVLLIPVAVSLPTAAWARPRATE